MNGKTPSQSIERFISLSQERLFDGMDINGVKLLIAVKYGVPMHLLSPEGDL